ncbi:MAG TPA: hypothetical protein PKV96_02410 [Candidatus Saccharimonas sp.]|jgi:hypothetical protein|nr:hypothetical protein [Candidatus Saccharimonas sp.]
MADIEVYDDHQRDTPPGDWGNNEATVQNNERPRGAELVKAEIAAMPLGEVSSQMVDCAKVAIEKNLGSVELPPEFAAIAGVRIDDCGVFRGEIPDPDTITYGIEHSFNSSVERERVGKVGTFNTNNGTITYVDHLGRYYVAPSSTRLLDALISAGYAQDGNLHVYCSNGDMPADPKRIKQIFVAQEVARAIEVLGQLEQLGIDKSGDVAGLVERCNDIATPEGERVAGNTKLRQQQLRQFQQAMTRHGMRQEGALPPEVQEVEDAKEAVPDTSRW